MRILLFALILLLQCRNDIQSETDTSSIYKNILPEHYLTGNYSPEKALIPYSNPREKTKVYLRPEVVEAFNRMIRDFESDSKTKIKQHIYITSGFRSYNDQKTIWEGKFSGKRKMRISINGKTPKEINTLILEYSSAPGTSRHHWGTDFDINVLTNDYYKKGGRGEFIYQWLIKNASRYGFCQPYNEYSKRNQQGYLEEKWHWSYLPLSAKFLNDWVALYKQGKISFRGKFAGSDYLENLPLTYVSSINDACIR